MRNLRSSWMIVLGLLAAAVGCSEDGGGGRGACATSADCGPNGECRSGLCWAVTDPDSDRTRRDVATVDAGDGEISPVEDALGADTAADVPATDVPDGEVDDQAACVPDCTGRVCGPDPVCGTNCGPSCSVGQACVDGSCVSEGDPLASLSSECAGFCTALCEFLLECGKDDPTCLDRCGASSRFQALSTAACLEGAQVIGLEECPLWLDCGGVACAIDEMCLEVLPGLSYQCAPICDHTQAQPACAGSAQCGTVTAANGAIMTALGMCFSLF